MVQAVYVDRRRVERRRESRAVSIERRSHDRRQGERRREQAEPEQDNFDVRRRRLRVQVLAARRAIGVSHDALKKKR